jgi:hypothetical protein
VTRPTHPALLAGALAFAAALGAACVPPTDPSEGQLGGRGRQVTTPEPPTTATTAAAAPDAGP